MVVGIVGAEDLKGRTDIAGGAFCRLGVGEILANPFSALEVTGLTILFEINAPVVEPIEVWTFLPIRRSMGLSEFNNGLLDSIKLFNTALNARAGNSRNSPLSNGSVELSPSPNFLF